MTDRKKQGLMIAFGFLVFAALAVLFPYTGDDWDWGSRLGLERMATLFADYNGRYLGNFLVIAQTRLKALDVVMKAACCVLAAVLCTRYARKGDAVTLAFAMGLFLIMPRGIFAQAIVWTAGFVNYVPSALISGWYLLMLKDTEKRLPEKKPGFFWVGLLMGVLGAWFMENITVFNIVLGVAVLGWLWWKFRRIPKAFLGFPLGAVLGAAAMFANSGYRVIAQGEDFYRQTPRGLLDTVKFMADNFQKILGSLVLDNWAFCLVLSVVLLAALKGRDKTRITRFWGIAHMVTLVMVLVGKVLLVWAEGLGLPDTTEMVVFIGIAAVFAVPYLVTVYVLAWLSADKKNWAMLLPLLCVPVCIGPLLLVRPIGDRCMFPGYLLLMMYLTGLFDQVREAGILPEGKKRLGVLAVAAVIVLQTLHLFGVYYPIHVLDKRVNAYAKIQAEQGSRVIRIADLSEEGYVHCSWPYNEFWWERYCLYYDLNPETRAELVPFEEFLTETNENLGK